MIAVRVAPLPVSAPASDRTALASLCADAALLDTVRGAQVVFLWPGCPNYYPAAQMTGRVVDVRTWRGQRQVSVVCELLNLPRWLALDECQFTWTTMDGEGCD